MYILVKKMEGKIIMTAFRNLLLAGLFACVFATLFLDNESYNFAHDRVTDILSGRDHMGELS